MIKNIKYSNNSLFIQFTDGEFIMQECDKDTALQIFNLAQEGADKETVYAILDPQFKKLVEEIEVVKQENQLLLDLVENITSDERFYFSENKLYRQGIPLSIPKILAEKVSECLQNNDQEELDRLDKFWAWSSLIRKPESRESLFPFIQKQKIQLTDLGEMVTYRRVLSLKPQNTTLIKFITQEYLKLRKNKKSTNVEVFINDGEYNLKEGDSVGILKDLYSSLTEMSGEFTDERTKSLDYRIGVESRMDYTEADWSDETCSRGFHSSGIEFSYRGFGDTPIVCLVNPKDVVNCVENSAKMRSLAFTPIAVLNSDCEWQDDKEIHKIIGELSNSRLNQLEQYIKEATFDELKDHTLLQELPNLDYSKLFSVIKEVVNPNIVKDRLIKV